MCVSDKMIESQAINEQLTSDSVQNIVALIESTSRNAIKMHNHLRQWSLLFASGHHNVRTLGHFALEAIRFINFSIDQRNNLKFADAVTLDDFDSRMA